MTVVLDCEPRVDKADRIDKKADRVDKVDAVETKVPPLSTL